MWNENFALALVCILFTFALFLIIVLTQRGGDNALFAILGYIGGCMNTIVLFYYRKKPEVK